MIYPKEGEIAAVPDTDRKVITIRARRGYCNVDGMYCAFYHVPRGDLCNERACSSTYHDGPEHDLAFIDVDVWATYRLTGAHK
ncbi:MAG: hypothetical protein JSS14_22035 [Proteobacteria bacterium]|nr:hypothetical protein [Pseudomonadota bacterium]